MSAAWTLLADELDEWIRAGLTATLWWRDDDACTATPALARLLAIARAHRVPVAIAAIPQGADAALVEAVHACAQATVVQHGYAHRNHAPSGERTAEMGSHRPLPIRLDEIVSGRVALAERFGERFHPVLVPPWNRIGEDLLPELASTGVCGLSRFGPREAVEAAPQVIQANAHVDPIAWRRARTFIGADEALTRVVAHLRARRKEEVDRHEPTGLLTHHLAFADDAFDFVGDLIARTSQHPAVRWLNVDDVFRRAA
jgi:hypothetical protein